MELLYIDMFFTTDQFKTESYYFYINYIIGEKTYMHSHIGFAKYVLENHKNFSIFDYVKCQETYSIMISRISDKIKDEEFKSNDAFLNEIKTVNKLKRKRNLNKNEFREINRFNSYLSETKNGLIEKCNLMIKFSNLQNNIELIDQEILYSDYSLFNREFEPIDDAISEIIYNNILNREKLFVEINTFGVIGVIIKDNISIELLGEKSKVIKIPEFPLFVFPLSKQISNEHLQIIRKQFNPTFNALLDKIQEFRKTNLNNDIDKVLIEKYIAFYNSLKIDLKKIQDEIDINIYFQKIKNSDSEYENVEVRMGILSILQLLQAYGTIDVISKNMVLKLFDRIYDDIGIFKGEIYIYYKVMSEN